MHSIRIDRDRLLVEVTLSGFYVPDEAMAITDEVRDAIRSLGAGVGRHVTLYDVSDVEIAPGPTIDRLKDAFADPSIRHLWARKVAYVSPSALARLQLKRLRAVRSDIGVFADRDTALAWLFAE